MPKSIPEMSVDSQVLVRRLESAQKGETIPYEELNGLISADVQRERRPLLYTAMRHVLAENQMVFACVHGEGIKRLTDAEVSGVGVDATCRIKRISSRALKKMATVDRDGLNKEQRVQLDASVTVLAFIKQGASPASQKKIAAAVESSGALPIGKTLDLFRKDVP